MRFMHMVFEIHTACPLIWVVHINYMQGDAGQALYEEIDVVTKGGNYGWNVKQGTHCFNAAIMIRYCLPAPTWIIWKSPH